MQLSGSLTIITKLSEAFHGRESEWTPGVDGQGGLACCDSWGRKESDTTERLNWTEMMIVCCCLLTKLCLTFCNPMDCSTPGLPVHHQPPEFTQTHVHWFSNPIQPSHPPSSPSPPAFNLSQHQGLSNESVLCITWPKYWRFSFSISLCNEYLGLYFFRIDSLDLLAVQGTLKRLLKHSSSKASILWCSAFFMVKLSHPWKNHSFD